MKRKPYGSDYQQQQQGYSAQQSALSSSQPTIPSSADSSTPTAAPEVKATPVGKFFCELCECYTNDQHAYMLHLNGKKHLNQLRRAGKAPPAPGQQIGEKPAKAAKTSSQRYSSNNLILMII
jgi:hypothetical protein